MSDSNAETPLDIDRSQIETARTVSIVLMCLAAFLPVLMIVVLSVLLKLRSLEQKRKQFADEWNTARLDSYNNKNSQEVSHMTSQKVSHISSSHLDVNYSIQNHDKSRIKRVSISPTQVQTSSHNEQKPRTLHYFNDAYIEDSDDGGPNTLEKPLGSLLIERVSTRASTFSQNSNTKNAIIQLINLQNNHSYGSIQNSQEPNLHLEYGITDSGNNKIDEMPSDNLNPSRQHSIISTKDKSNHMKPLETKSDTWNPEYYTGSIDWVGNDSDPSIKSNSSISKPIVAGLETKSSLKNSDIFFQSKKSDFVELPKHGSFSWEISDETKSKDTSLNELDYFGSPVTSEQGSIYKYSGRRFTNTTSKLNNHAAYPQSNKYYNQLNPLYEDFNSETDFTRALGYYKTRGDSSEWNADKTKDSNDTVDEESPTLHRHPGILDLNAILESDESIGKSVELDNTSDKRTPEYICNFEDHVLPPPPLFCDSPKLDQTHLNSKPKPPQPPPKPYKSSNFTKSSETIPSSDFEQTLGNKGESHHNIFDNLPEVQAKKKFVDRRTSSKKYRSNEIINKESILKEEEELALKYFEDICRELSIDSDIVNDEKQQTENTSDDKPSIMQLTDNLSTPFSRPSKAKDASILTGDLPPNFRKSYEHLLSPDYPYQRRKIISSELIVNSPSEKLGTKLKTVDNLTADENINKSQLKGGWIVTHM